MNSLENVNREAAPTGKCWCGCGRPANKFFAPGHDRRAETAIFQLLSEGKYDRNVIANFLFERGYGPDKSVVDAAEKMMERK